MKEYLNKIEISPLNDIQSIDDTTVNMKTGKQCYIFLTQNDLLPDEQSGEKDGKLYYSQTLMAYIDKQDEDLLNQLLDRKVVVKLFHSDETVVLLGSLTFPARCKAIPSLINDTLKIDCQSALPMLS